MAVSIHTSRMLRQSEELMHTRNVYILQHVYVPGPLKMAGLCQHRAKTQTSRIKSLKGGSAKSLETLGNNGTEVKRCMR